MSVYRSLIFREFKITRRTVILRFVLIFLIAVILALPVLMGMFSEPDAADTGSPTEFSIVLALLAGTAGILASLDTGIYRSDVNTGWARYSYVLPVTARQKAGAMFLTKLIMMAGAFVIVLIEPVAMSLMEKGHFREFLMVTLNSYIAAFAVGFIISSAQQAVIIWARDKDAMKKLGIVAGVIGIGLFELASNVIPNMNNEEGVSESKLRAGIRLMTKLSTSLVLAGVLAALMAASFIVTLKALGRREQ